MNNEQRWKRLSERLDEIDAYRRSVARLQFDMECCAPPEGMTRAGDDMSLLGRRLYSLTHARGYRLLVEALHENGEGLTPVQQRTVEQLYRALQREKNIPARLAYETDRIRNRAYGAWYAAKKAGDFSLFRDSLAASVENTRTLIALRDRKYSTWYEACLDDTEPGGSEAQLDAFFARLKERIVPLLRHIQAEGKPIRDDFVTRPCPIDRQEALAHWLLEQEGLRASALTLMTTEHPFTETFGPCDVRVTTHYYENNFFSSLYSTLHEGGHALVMQNELAEVVAAHGDNYASNGQHECISRFYENLVGRSEAFIHFAYPKLKELCGDCLADVSERELYEAVNIARPGLLRTEADELSYCLHIMIRYELEKAFVNGTISVDEVPALWREKYRDYLGLEVPDDRQGCLQDVHWTSDFGYFPSYALGNAYGAQILRRMKQDFDVDGAIREGRLDRVRDWLTERVFSRISTEDPDAWIRSITGEGLNVDYYLDYLEEKYTALYELQKE